MKMITFTEFRKNAYNLITKVEQGETLILIRRGKPVAEIIPFPEDLSKKMPSWKQPVNRLQISGGTLSSAIIEEREESA